MKRYQYTCKLLSDVVISSVTATEGFNPSLNYIPGAKFLGIVAGKLYDKNSPNTLDIFHNGKVRFGDAYPLIQGKVGLPVPFSWFYLKGEGLTTNPVYLHHKMKDNDFKKLTYLGKQIKQARKGYFNEDGKYLSIDQNFAIRSAYDRIEMRSKEGQMFGYFSLPKGSKWTFTIEDDTDEHADNIRASIIGKKNIGRSRSAEYGLVEIDFEQALTVDSKIISPSELTLIYALSNLCFYDQYGRPTLTPTPAQLGVPGGKVLWEKSQIRSRLYQTWNRIRHNRDSDRMIIEKGSVIAIEHKKPINTISFIGGIGFHKSEGFGQVLINPIFLLSEGIKLNSKLTKAEELPKAVNLTPTGNPSAKDTLIMKYLEQKQIQKSSAFNLDEKVNKFLKDHIGDFVGISPSQWGTVRAYAKHAANWDTLLKLLFDENVGALHRGQSESEWRKSGRREKLFNFLKNEVVYEADRVTFTIKLASEMAKRKLIKQKI